MNRALSFFALALLLTGCASSPTPSTGPTSHSAEATLKPVTDPTFDAPVALALLGGPEEPLAVTDTTGRIYAWAPLNEILSRSDDGGKTFRMLFDAKTTPTDSRNDGDIIAASDGTVYVSGENAGGSGKLILSLLSSTDGGVTWVKRSDLATGSNIDRQWLASGSAGHVVGVWRDRNDPAHIVTGLRVSNDSGGTWTPEVPLTKSAQPGPLLAGRDGHAYWYPYRDYDADKEMVARSDDGGVTWKHYEVGPADGVTPVLAEDAAGTLYLVYNQIGNGVYPPQRGVGGPMTTLFSASHDRGATWSKPVEISPPGRNTALPWIVAGQKGRVAIAWYEDTMGGYGRGTADTWYAGLLVSDYADAASPTWYHGLATTQPGHVGSICSDCNVGESRLDTLGLTLAADGAPIIVWQQDSPGNPLAVGGTMVASRATNVRLG